MHSLSKIILVLIIIIPSKIILKRLTGLVQNCVVVKIAHIGTRTRICHSRVRRSAGLSIPGRDTYYVVQCIYLSIALTL